MLLNEIAFIPEADMVNVSCGLHPSEEPE